MITVLAFMLGIMYGVRCSSAKEDQSLCKSGYSDLEILIS